MISAKWSKVSSENKSRLKRAANAELIAIDGKGPDGGIERANLLYNELTMRLGHSRRGTKYRI